MIRLVPALALCFSLVLAALAPPVAWAGRAGGLRMLTPPGDAVTQSPDLLLVYTVLPETRVSHELRGKPTEMRDACVPGNDEDLHHVRVPLEAGKQVVRILDAATESELGLLTVTYVPPYSLQTALYRRDRKYTFHTKGQEATCSSCHNLPDVFETIPDRPLAPAGKVCGACHPRIEAAPNLHGPVAVYACFRCHEPHFNPSRFAQKTSQPASCGSCHEGFLSRVLGGKKFVHGPAASGDCVVCHDPHGARTRALVREAPPKLCILCHAETLPLPVERNLHGSVPCTQCHDPHGGQSRAFTASEGDAFCGGCHAGVVGTRAEHPAGQPAVSASAGPSEAAKAPRCAGCHDPHSPKDASKHSNSKSKL